MSVISRSLSRALVSKKQLPINSFMRVLYVMSRTPICDRRSQITLELISYFFSEFIALFRGIYQRDGHSICPFNLKAWQHLYTAKRAVNDIEASIQSTNGIYRPISFLPLIPAIDLSSLPRFSYRAERFSDGGRCSPKISKVLSFFFPLSLRIFRK